MKPCVEIEGLKAELNLCPNAHDVREILERPISATSYSDCINAASVVFHNVRAREASFDDILMTGDVTPEVLESLQDELYDGYNVLKAPHHGTASGYCRLFSEMSAAHILISNGEYHAGGSVAQEYIDLQDSVRHCTNHNACKWFQTSQACCNRFLFRYCLLDTRSQIQGWYQTGSVKIAAADHLNFYVDKGEFCIIVGPSGAGKTTLLNILGGMDNCDEGNVWLDAPAAEKNIPSMNKTYPVLGSAAPCDSAIFHCCPVGFLAGLLSLWICTFSADEADLYDIRILSTLGLTDSDLEEVRKLDEVEAVMPVHDSDFCPAVFRRGLLHHKNAQSAVRHWRRQRRLSEPPDPGGGPTAGKGG